MTTVILEVIFKKKKWYQRDAAKRIKKWLETECYFAYETEVSIDGEGHLILILRDNEELVKSGFTSIKEIGLNARDTLISLNPHSIYKILVKFL